MEFILDFINGNWSSFPLVVVIIVIIIEFNHKNDITLLINRISHLKIGGNQLDLGAGPIQSENFKQIKEKDGDGSLGKDDKNDDLDDIDTIKKYYKFEQIYNMAFGSQLQMLSVIRTNGNQPMPYNYALSFFNTYQNMLPPVNRSPNNEWLYFKWLIDVNLVKQENNSFVLTDYGMDFLMYLFKRNYNLNLKLF